MATGVQRWRRSVVPLIFVCVGGQAVPSPATAAASPTTELSLAELLAFAASDDAPLVQRTARRRGYAAAARKAAAPRLRHNPTLEFGIGPRVGGSGDVDFDFVASLAQPVEVGGARKQRIDAASRLDERLAAEAQAIHWEIRRDLVLAYKSAVLGRERIQSADRMIQFADEMLLITQRRLTAGDTTAIDLRLAQADLAQARQSRLEAERDLQTARIRLAELAGLPIETPPMVPPGLDPPTTVPSLAALMDLAADNHPELQRQRAAVAEARAQVELSEREAWPAPVLGVQVAREGSAGSPANYIVLGMVGWTLPLWQRNSGERGRARVDEEVASAEVSATTRTLQSRIARAHAELSSAAERLALYTSTVSPSLADSLALLRRGFEAGELSFVMVAAARDRFLVAERAALDAYDDYYQALAELEFALGSPLVAAGERGVP